MIVIGLSILGALILLDKYAFGEFGISQPVVSGAIIGALCGDVRMGIYIGALVQLVFIANLPIGKNVPPDAQGAGIAGCGSYFIIKKTSTFEPNLLVIILIAIFVAILGGLLDTIVRRINGRLYYHFLRSRSRLFFYHFAGLLTAFLGGIILLLPLFATVSSLYFPVLTDSFSIEFLKIIIVGLGMANGLYLFVRRNSYYYTILGLICALAFLVF